jgi:CubicO group peptidase (beta-lactamase class C family)
MDSIAPPEFASVTALLESSTERKDIAGAVALVARDHRIVYRKAVGYQDVEQKLPMSLDTIFRIASMTKPITSVAAMMLVEEGKLALQEPIGSYIPEFDAVQVIPVGSLLSTKPVPANRPITLHDLLTHTSGITYGIVGQQPHSRLFAAAGICDGLIESPLTLKENIALLARQPLVHPPGEGWQYGLSTDVVGRIIEVASGLSLETFFKQRIFEPLEMRDTGFTIPDEKLARFARLYRPGADMKITPVDTGPQLTGTVRYSATFHTPGASNYRSGGAGLVSTASDYLAFAEMLLGKGRYGQLRLLNENTIAMMTKNQIGELSNAYPHHGEKFGYGFGILDKPSGTTGASAGTYAWGGAFQTNFWIDPAANVIGILLTQLIPSDHLSLRSAFQTRVYQTIQPFLHRKRLENRRGNW